MTEGLDSLKRDFERDPANLEKKRAYEKALERSGSRRFAVIADVHSNLHALEAVLGDIQSREIPEIYCIGHSLSGGHRPLECLRLLRKHCKVYTKGWSEYLLAQNKVSQVGRSGACLRFARREIQEISAKTGEGIWDYLAALPDRHIEEAFYFVYSMPDKPWNDGIFIMDIHDCQFEKFERIFEAFDRLLFVGSAHRQYVISRDLEYHTPKEIDSRFKIPESPDKFIIGVGGVSPRDTDHRAAYVEYFNGEVFFHRVNYDFEKTYQEVRDNPDIPSQFAERIRRAV